MKKYAGEDWLLSDNIPSLELILAKYVSVYMNPEITYEPLALIMFEWNNSTEKGNLRKILDMELNQLCIAANSNSIIAQLLVADLITESYGPGYSLEKCRYKL